MSDVKKKDVEKLWKKFFKEYADAKVKKNSKAKEYYSLGVRINKITPNEMDVYAKFEDYSSGVTVSLCYDLGNNFISNETPNEYNGAEEFTTEFLNYVKTFTLEEQLEEEEKLLEDLQDDLKDAKKANKKLHEKIEKYTKKIQEAEKKIEDNLSEQESLTKKIEEQLTTVKEFQDKVKNVGK